MENTDNTTLVALIAAIAAIIAPVITSVVSGILENQKHKDDLAFSKFQMMYPVKREVYLKLVSELSDILDSGGQHYDRVELLKLLHQAILLADEPSQKILFYFHNNCFLNDEAPWNLAKSVIIELSRELSDTQARIDKLQIRNK